MKKENINKRSKFLMTTMGAVIVVVAACVAFAWYQLYNLENGILDVCATQQDAYVQLVVDQINLKENRDDQEIINDILSTLDSSTSKYWTFSKDRSMLFVKDIIETNRYKGLTTVTYYDSESAKDFLNALQKDRVIHKSIIIDDKEYVASGVSFSYSGEDYRLCLLTNKTVLLNNNRFMSAKLEIIILIGFMIVASMAVILLYARRIDAMGKVAKEKNIEIERLQGMVGELNELLTQKEHYDTRYQIWSRDSLKGFLEKLKGKGVNDVYAAEVRFKEVHYRHTFLEKAGVLLDKKVLRFLVDDCNMLLLYVQYNEVDVHNSLHPLLNEGVNVERVQELNFESLDIESYFNAVAPSDK
ncbi:MAG: hypothetical protein IJB96_00805 [Lachnospira sp.]|nr:hypothetical protein [Lachnospira sp.]